MRMVPVPNPVLNPTLIPSTAPISFPSPREDGSGVPVGRAAVPKGTFLKGFVFTGIEPGYSCELAGVGFDVLLKQLPDFLGGVGAIDPVVGDFRIADSSVDSPVGKFG